MSRFNCRIRFEPFIVTCNSYNNEKRVCRKSRGSDVISKEHLDFYKKTFSYHKKNVSGGSIYSFKLKLE